MQPGILGIGRFDLGLLQGDGNLCMKFERLAEFAVYCWPSATEQHQRGIASSYRLKLIQSHRYAQKRSSRI